MDNKGTSFIDRIKITLMMLEFIWKRDDVAMIDILIAKKEEWEHHIITSNILTSNKHRVKEIVKSFKDVLEQIFWSEIS